MTAFSRLGLSAIRVATRLWPFPSGKDLPAHLGAWATRIGFLGSEWFEFQPGLWMQLNARDLIQQTILLEGVWDPSLTGLIDETLRPGDVFIDVGAHVGYFTLLAARRVGQSGRVLSIEPNPVALRQLEQNVRRSSLQNVIVAHSACAESAGVVRLYLHTESNSSMASLSAANATSGAAVEVPCTSLDHLFKEQRLPRANLVKIDVEGAELQVLRGMGDTIRDMRPTIVLELEPHLLKRCGATTEEVLALLAGFDYSCSPLGGHSNYVFRPRRG